MKGLTRAEQETVIRWDEADQVVHIWSASPVTWRKMARLGIPLVRETTIRGIPSGRFYRLPITEFRWRTKRKARSGHVPPGFRRGDPVNPGTPRRPRGAEEAPGHG